MTEQNFQDEEERQQYAAWRAGYQDPEAAARGAWIVAKHGWAIAQSLQADFARAKRFEAAYLVWQEKTEWVQQTSKAQELGKHRADVLRERIEAMERENAGLREQMAAIGAGGVEPLRKAAHTPKDWLAAVPTLSTDFAVHVPAFTPLAQHKLMALLSQGFIVTGYSIERADPEWSPQRGFVTHGGLVGWWLPHATDLQVRALPDAPTSPTEQQTGARKDAES